MIILMLCCPQDITSHFLRKLKLRFSHPLDQKEMTLWEQQTIFNPSMVLSIFLWSVPKAFVARSCVEIYMGHVLMRSSLHRKRKGEITYQYSQSFLKLLLTFQGQTLSWLFKVHDWWIWVLRVIIVIEELVFLHFYKNYFKWIGYMSGDILLDNSISKLLPSILSSEFCKEKDFWCVATGQRYDIYEGKNEEKLHS